MSLKVATCILTLIALFIANELVVSALPTVIHPSTDVSSFLPHVATGDKILSSTDFSPLGHTSVPSSQEFKSEEPKELEVPVTESVKDRNEIYSPSNSPNAINNPSDLKDEINLTTGGNSAQPANTESEGLISDTEIRETTMSPMVPSENEKVTMATSSMPSTQDSNVTPGHLINKSIESSTVSKSDDVIDVISNVTDIENATDGESSKLTSITSPPAVEDEVSLPPISSATSVTSSIFPTTNPSNEALKEIDTDTLVDKTTESALSINEVDTSDMISSPSPSLALSSSPSSGALDTTTAGAASPLVTDETKYENTSAVAITSHVTQTVREGRTDDFESESINYDESAVTSVPASSSGVAPVSTMFQENNSISTKENDTSSTIQFPATVVDSVNETREMILNDSQSFYPADQSKLPPSEQVTTPVGASSSISHFLPTARRPSVPGDSRAVVPLATALFNTTANYSEQVDSSGDNITITSFTGQSDHTEGQIPVVTTMLPPVASATEEPVEPLATGSTTNTLSTQMTEKETVNASDKNASSTQRELNSSRSESPVTEILKSSREESEEAMTTTPSRSLVYPEVTSNDVAHDNPAIESEKDASETPVPLDILDTTPRASGDRSARRESSSIFASCINSVEMIVVSIALIFFTASALVICLLVGFCKRKGNTFDVQDPRNPLPPSFPRSMMSKPAHHNCRVTGPAIFGSHPLNRLQGYDLNSPSEILKDEEGGHYTCRSRSSPSGYSVNNNNNNNNNNNGKEDVEKESILLKPLHFCGPADYVKKSSTLEYPVGLNSGFSLKNNVNHHEAPSLHTGYHSPNGYKSLPGGGRFFVNDAWMLGCLPHVTCSSNERRTSLSSRTSYNSYENTTRRHSCPPRHPFIQLAPGVSNIPSYMYHGPEHALAPFGLPANCLKCAGVTRDGQIPPLADNITFFPVTSDEMPQYRATSSKKNQATSPRRGSSGSPLSSATESADSNSSHSGLPAFRHSSIPSTCKSSQLSSAKTNPAKLNTSLADSSPTKACKNTVTHEKKSARSGIKSSGSSPFSKDGHGSSDPEVTDTKL